ncbi:MAG: 3-dehydroquinate synthase [Rhizobiaceae bacterium]|nr:3-dehydroquinate synthase [Rhizobiaceae bacterium]
MTDQHVHSNNTTTTLMQRFAVPFEFPVSFTENLFDPENTTLIETLCRKEADKKHKVIIFLDDGLANNRPELVDKIKAYAAHHSEHMDLVADPFLVPGGEKIKTDLHFIEQMQKTLYDYHIDRHSFAIAIGGGAVLDAAGLVAATAHRGIRHIRIPTTVLSQNDSGVGVKNGTNLYGTKNYVGTFAPPFAVLNDIAFIMNLGVRDKIAGMAEAVKVALIRDADFFKWLEQNSDDLATFKKPAMAYMIQRCAELHMKQIGQGGDPFEMGSARPLDYGHWSAHKLESMTHYHLRHGEAVAIGIALDARYSVLKGLLKPGEEDRICFLLEHLGFKLWHPALENRNIENQLEVIIGLREFREHLGGELTITLLADIGVGVEVHEMDDDLVVQSINWLKLRQEN